MKSILDVLSFTLSLLVISTSAAHAFEVPKFLDIARNSSGQVLMMTRSEALQYCRNPRQVPQPAHLPKARELMYLSMSLGSTGPKKDCFWDYKCSLFDVREIDSSYDRINFSNEDYRRPSGDDGIYSFWSSSQNPDFPYQYILLNGKYGGFNRSAIDRYNHGSIDWDQVYNAVRCVSGPDGF